jgi:hypothetical protein
MPPKPPPFAQGRRWHVRASKASKHIDHRVWHDQDNDFEYEPDPTPAKGTWHEIDWRRKMYREIDRETGRRVAGGEGEWRRLR